MSINVLGRGTPGGAGRKRGVATSSAAARAAASTQALGSGAVASDSGSTAVQSNGVLSKVGGFLNKVSSVAQYMPGWVGKIGGIVNQLTSANDPEWWNTVPGDGVTCNDPLQLIELGKYPNTSIASAFVIQDWTLTEQTYVAEYEAAHAPTASVVRPTFLELMSTNGIVSVDGSNNFVIEPTDNMIVQYLLPQIRHVINAVYLQDAQYYKKALQVQATMYALWRHFKKIDYFLKHGKPFVPNTNDPAFPIFQVENAAFLQSLITRLEEYLHANVRLPHTLCEYLTWRFGRIYKINPSAKSAFVMYNVWPLSRPISTINQFIAKLQNIISSSEAVQKAAADIYNGYSDHDQEVLLLDENVIAYDPKEFVLRTNLDLRNEAQFFADTKVKNNILMDSNLDNPTTFMASTISCQVKVDDYALFPVFFANIYAYFNDVEAYNVDYRKFIGAMAGAYGAGTADTHFVTPPGVRFDPLNPLGPVPTTDMPDYTDSFFVRLGFVDQASRWYYMTVHPGLMMPTPQLASNYWRGYYGSAASKDPLSANCFGLYAQFALQVSMCKAMEFYNVGFYLPLTPVTSTGHVKMPVQSTFFSHDCTSLAQDQGVVEDTIIINEQVLAFANLMAVEHKDKTTYRQVERRVAKDLANTMESIPLASVEK